MASYNYDITVIGGGIVGIATAMQISAKYPRYKIGVVEKEDALAMHQSGHNSGVIHSGIYYAPGSLKAQNCVTGVQKLLRFCDENGIKYDLCGKVIVATSEDELPRLDELHRRGTANGVPGLEMIDQDRLRGDRAALRRHQGALVAKDGHHRLHRSHASLCTSPAGARRRDHPGRQGGEHPRRRRPHAPHDEQRRRADEVPDQLRRTLLGRGCAHDGPLAGTAHRAVPRRVLLDKAGVASSGEGADLPGAGPGVPVPGRALHAHDPRRRRGRAQRRPGDSAGGLHEDRASSPRSCSGP